MIEKVSKKSTDLTELNLLGNKTIMSYADFHQIFTDGSAFKGIINAGYRARIDYTDSEFDHFHKQLTIWYS